MDAQTVLENIRAIAADWRPQTVERQQRRALDRADFDRLAEAGFLGTGLPASLGGLFASVPLSVRSICAMLRELAHGDPSVALVASMHPAVVFWWLLDDEPDGDLAAPWRAQRDMVRDTVRGGAWWGTIASEPGSGGDILKTRTTAVPTDGDGLYRITGDKHFGSGSGITSYMITTAVAGDEGVPDIFFLDVRDAPWDGSTGVRLAAEWDGHGMAATQSHAFRFENYPATRLAWPGRALELSAAAGAYWNCLFTAVCAGIVDTAVATARERVRAKRDGLRPYEQVEWTRVQNEAWLIEQAYEGMLRAAETEEIPLVATLHAKVAIAELAEALTARICKVLGGATFSRRAPFSGFAQDVRALGFLRPPWGLAFDQLAQLT